MKQTTLTQRLLSALVALCMVLSVCAPALAANSSFIWIQKSSGYPTPVTSDNIGTLLPGYSIAYNGNTVTITMGSGQHTQELEGVTLIGGGQDLELCTAGTAWMTDIRSSSNIGLTITGMKNVTVKPAEGSSIGFLGSLKIVDCTGDVNIQNSSYAAVVGRLEVDNSKGSGKVTITENCDRADWGTYLPHGMIITSNGPVTIENKNGCAVCGSLEIKESDSVDIKGTATKGRAAILGSATISSNGAVKIENQTSKDWKAGAAVGYLDDPNITGTILEVKKSASVEVIGAGVNPTLGGWAFIKSSGDVSITNSLGGSAVGRGLTVTTGGAVTVTGDNDAAIKSKATITAGRNVSIQNKSGNATLNNDADITSRGAVSITNTGSGLAVDGKLTVYNSGSVKVSGGNASAPAVSGDITLTSTGKMELSNPKGQVTNKKLTVKNSTGEVIVTGNKSGSTALVKCGASIDTTGAVTITNSSGPAIFGGLNVEQSGGITVTGRQASAPIITGNSTIKDTNKVEIINNEISGKTAQNITYTPPAGKGYFYQTAQNGGKLHTRSAISSTTPYLCIEPENLYTLTLPEGVTAKTNGISDTSFYAGEMVTVTAPADTNTKKFEKWTFSGTEPTGLPNGWEHKPSFSFTMPAGNVTLTADYMQLYNLTVKGGTIVDGTGDPGKTSGIYLPGTEVTVVFTESTGIADQFEKWTGGDNIIDAPSNWRNSNTFTFKMPEGNVTLTAKCKTAYTLTVDGGKGTILVNGVAGNRALAGDQITVTETGSDKYHLFSSWQLTSSTPLVRPSDNWENSKEFTFTMPAGDVSLKADYKQLYDLTVNGGTIVNGTNTGIYLPGTEVTVCFTDSDDITKQFKQWTYTGTAPEEPDGGWTSENDSTSKTFTFKMPAGNVTLTADYMQLYNLTVTGGTIVDENEPSKTTGIYLPGTKVTVCFTDSDDITKQFKQWTYTGTAPEEPDGGWTSENDKNSKTFTFKMPKGNVTLTAECKTAYTLTVDGGRGSFTVNGAARTQALEGETVTVKTSDTFFDAYRKFDGWKFTSGTEPTGLPDGWQNSPEFTFTMPADNVTLTADYKQLYDLTVTGGTIVDESSDTGKPSGIYLPGTEVTIQFTESDEITEQFKQWTGGENITDADPANWQNSERFTFTMPDSAVTLTAVYRETYHLSEYTNKAEFFVNDQQVHQAPAGVRVTVKLVDGFINDHREFDQWLPAGGTALVDPEEGWEHKPSFSFIMPEGSVLLQVHTTFLYDVIVTHGTIVDGTGDTGTFQKIVKPGQPVTVRAESTEENPFLQWTYTGKEPVEPDDGWPEGGWQTSPEFTFKMPNGDVTLEAQLDQLYKVSINDSLGSVTINGEPRSSLWVKEGDTVTVATTLKDGYWMEFMKWTEQDGSATPVEPSDNWQTSTAFTFKMPNGPVELVAQWSASSLDPYQPIDPDEPLDEDFGVEPAPMDTTGGTIAAVAVGGAAIWGGYEIATRVILHSLLPEGTVIPASRGQLALLVWNTAGRPEPAGAPAFADVTDPDMAKAAQWCTEQGAMAAKGDRFEPEGWTPKFKVIEVWNKAFPAA